MTSSEIKANREKYEDDNYVRQIDCPIHPAHEARDHHDPDDLHQATLFCQGHRFAGIWECPITGESDSCEHSERHIESVQVDYWPTPDIDSSYDVDVYVCDQCGVTIEDEDPAVDRAEAQADMQIDEARGE